MADHGTNQSLDHHEDPMEGWVPPPRFYTAPSQPSPTEKLSVAERERQLAHLDAKFDRDLLAVKQEAKADKAASIARKELREHLKQFDTRIRFRTRNTRPLFRWLHSFWEVFKEIPVGEKERKRLEYAICRYDKQIDAWIREQEEELAKEWNETRKQIMAMSVVP
ncbi:hypothetical protein B0H67DRAFT_547750 [Lasiosphaeris hirsuta]|uniref:Uncharacterized protein n=1 Tax=Lasiosphaeris hirsuta TaxID=260670 RepID=A0AA40B8L2_9PEZI|nr:hypothetical protein B0H67DRAFT_547750 [Lasiosphaeris hirsuta]